MDHKVENASIFEFYYDNIKHQINIQEFVFESPEAFTVRGKYRGEKMTWEAEWWDTVTFRKMN